MGGSPARVGRTPLKMGAIPAGDLPYYRRSRSSPRNPILVMARPLHVAGVFLDVATYRITHSGAVLRFDSPEMPSPMGD